MRSSRAESDLQLLDSITSQRHAAGTGAKREAPVWFEFNSNPPGPGDAAMVSERLKEW
jgi:hypothetical protein